MSSPVRPTGAAEMLTEPEVAEILRCSTSKVKRLRLGGKLAYLPGRPVLVSRADLAAYIDSMKVGATTPDPGVAAKAAARAKAEAEAAWRSQGNRGPMNPREWAIKKKLTRRSKKV